ncbi:MAG: hypothetical protein WC773_01665 [Patescibacteria group bacterium]|jgi:hypothetical protein
MNNYLLDYFKNYKKSPEFKRLHSQLRTQQAQVQQTFHHTHKHAKKLLRKHRIVLGHLRHGSTKAFAGAALASSLFVAPIHTQTIHTDKAQAKIPEVSQTSLVPGPTNPNVHQMTQDEFKDALQRIIGTSLAREGKLTDSQLSQIETLIQQQFNLEISNKTASGFELKDHYGYMGAEQHLPTKPGDTASNHVNSRDPLAILTGITPGRGAWGYAPAGPEELNYFVAQTWLSDQFGTAASKNLAGQRYLVIQAPNARNGNRVSVQVTDIRDAGPGISTRKVFGGSPEVMDALGSAISGGPRNDQVIALPILTDVPSNQLGPRSFK